MANSGYVLEDLLTTIIPLFLVFVVQFHKINYIGGILETRIAQNFMIYIRIFLMFGHYEV